MKKTIDPREKDKLKRIVSRVLATDDLAEDLSAMLLSPHFQEFYFHNWSKWGKVLWVLKSAMNAFERKLADTQFRFSVVDSASKDGKVFYFVAREETFTLINQEGLVGYDFMSPEPGYEKINILSYIDRPEYLKILFSLARVESKYARKILTRALMHGYPFPDRPEKTGLLTEIKRWLDKKDIPARTLPDL